MMETVIQWDKQLLLLLNGSDSWLLDSLMMTLTNALTWIPFYLALVYMVVRANRHLKGVLCVIGCVALCLLFAGAFDDLVVKPLVARLRPTHDPEIGGLVRTVDNYRETLYGFFSAHAANTFSVALFLSLLVRRRMLTITLIAWSLLNAWTRIYLGVHYPGDVLAGLLWGAMVGYAVYRFSLRLLVPADDSLLVRADDSLSMPADYSVSFCRIPVLIFLLTTIGTLLSVIIFKSLI